jgi:hypothetical protein
VFSMVCFWWGLDGGDWEFLSQAVEILFDERKLWMGMGMRKEEFSRMAGMEYRCVGFGVRCVVW